MSGQETKKIPKTAYFNEMIATVNHSFSMVGEPFYPRFYTVASDVGDEIFIVKEHEALKKTLELSSKETLISAVLLWLDKNRPGESAFMWDYNTAKAFADLWMAKTPPRFKAKEIKEIAEKSEDVWCYHRLPWDFDVEAPQPETPLISEFLSRMTNADSFCTFIGMTFFADFSLQQYLWIYGDGMNGKGAMLRMLHRAFGRACHSDVADAYVVKSPFYTSSFFGKILVYFPDCNNSGFVTSGKFKAMSGGDIIRVERKFERPFSAKFNARYIFVSNVLPQIGSQRSDQRRIILCSVKPIDLNNIAETRYEDRLWEEVYGFLLYCKKCAVNFLESKKSMIPVNDLEDVEFLGMQNESFWEHIFLENFTLEHSGKLRGHELIAILNNAGLKSGPEQSQFIQWIFRTYPVLKKKFESGFFYVGLRLKTQMEKNYEARREDIAANNTTQKKLLVQHLERVRSEEEQMNNVTQIHAREKKD